MNLIVGEGHRATFGVIYRCSKQLEATARAIMSQRDQKHERHHEEEPCSGRNAGFPLEQPSCKSLPDTSGPVTLGR